VYPPECDELLTDEGKDMIAVQNILFKPGRILASPGCIHELERAGQNLWEFMARHIAGDWGVVDADDAEANNESLKDGSRLLSAYLLKTGEKIWIITEAEDENGHRIASTGILPSEY
jgi:hypothetical protein